LRLATTPVERVLDQIGCVAGRVEILGGDLHISVDRCSSIVTEANFAR